MLTLLKVKSKSILGQSLDSQKINENTINLDIFYM